MTGAASLRELLGSWNEGGVAPVEGEGLLDRIGIDDFTIREQPTGTSYRVTLVFEDEIGFAMPGLDSMGLYLGSHGSASRLDVEVDFGPSFAVRLVDVSVILRVPPAVLRPVRREGDKWVPVTRPDGTPAPYDMAIGRVTVGYASDGGFTISYPAGAPAIGLPPAMIADSGVVIESEAIAVYLDPNGPPPPGQPAGFLGVHIARAAVHLPESMGAAVPRDLVFENCSIGTGGFTGQISANWVPPFSGTVGGVTFGLRRVALGFVRNSLTAAEIGGTLELPFFEQPVGVDVAISLDGSILVAVSAIQPPGVTTRSGLIEFEKPGLIKISVEALGFSYSAGIFLAKLSGSMTPLALGENAPSFTVRELSIDSEGRVRLEGGWMNLPAQYAIDFSGFKLEISKVGFGSTEDGRKWVGFSGGLKLVDALPAGASVEGLRLLWTENPFSWGVTLNGVGVEFEVPGVVKFKGAISFSGPIESEVFDTAGQSLGMERVERFDGSILLDLTAIGLRIEAVLVVGSATGARGNYAFFAIYLGVDLPAGIPLGATGLGLYGFAGLFALSMEPNRRRDEKWYGVGPTDGWYKRNGIIGVNNLKTKWDPNPGAVAFGAGVTLGTVSDNGFTFAARVLLVIAIPGPIIMLEGKANLLKERATLADDPLFRLLAVLDGRAGNVTLGLDVHYQYEEDGELIDIRGGVEAFYDFHDPDAWHIYVGEREPRERRIRANIFELFKAEAYLMLDPRQLQTGAWIGYDNSWTFGPLKVTLEAWLEGNASLSFKPPQFHGDVWLHGKIAANVFGFGLSLVADATCEADVFRPFHLLFDVHVAIDLPWFLPDFAADATLEFGPVPDPPPLPLPLKEVAVEHFKVTTKWPLPRATLLLPDYDGADADGLRTPDGVLDTNDPAPPGNGIPVGVPVVPLDARPRLAFGRAVHDSAMIGVNPAPVLPAAMPEAGWEWLGDPALNQGGARVRYRLTRVALEKYTGGASPWTEVACKPAKNGVEELYGSWAPVPQLPSGTGASGTEPPVANVKLWLWSKSPFDYTRQTGRAWDEWFTDHFPSYPCVPAPPDRVLCCDFDALPVGTRLTSPWICPDHPEVTLEWTRGAVGVVTAFETPIDGHARALCFPGSIPGRRGTTTPVTITVTLPDGGKGVSVLVQDPEGDPGDDRGGDSRDSTRTCVRFTSEPPGPGANPRVEQKVTFTAMTAARAPAAETRLVPSSVGTVLDCAYGLDIALPCEARRVELTLVHHGTPAAIRALARDGTVMRTARMRGAPGQPERVTIDGRGIARVIVDAPQDETQLIELCYLCASVVTVTGTDTHGDPVRGTSTEDVPAGERGGRVIAVHDPSLASAAIGSSSGACVARVCVTLGPDPADVRRHEAMTRHMSAELARWAQTGEVLEPDTTYRLLVETQIDVKDWAWESPPAPFGFLATKYEGTRTQTEYAYFRTQGPPGLAQLALPAGITDPSTFDSGLGDLTRYVAQTVPPTVPAPGEPPSLPRPVYRAYDVGVRFNEDYVDLMYRAAQRDLALYLYDNNNQPVRDARGRLVVPDNYWGRAETRTLSEAEKHWIATVNESTCATLDETTLPPDRTLSISDGTVLDPDRVYEGRLVPLLVHDDGSGGRVGWDAPIDQGGTGGPSAWAARYHATISGVSATAAQSVLTLDGSPDLAGLDVAFDVITLSSDTARASRRYRIVSVDAAAKKVTVDGTPTLAGGTSPWEIPSLGAFVQTAAITGGTTAANDPVKPGTMLVRGDAATWTDYRFSVRMRNSAAATAAPGAIGVVFRAVDGNNYYRFSMDQTRRYRRLVRVVNGAHTVLAEDDVAYAANSDYLVMVEALGDRIRIYLDGALLFDVQDAAHERGKVGLYTWATATARFTDARVDDFRENAPIVYRFKFTTSQFANFFHHLHSYADEVWRSTAAVATHAAKARVPNTAPTDQERRDFEALEAAVLGPAASRTPAQVEVMRLDDNGLRGFLVRSPEPIDWSRTSLALSRASGVLARPAPPQAVKLTGASFGTVRPNEESVTLLLREAVDLSGYQIERRVMPAAIAEPAGEGTYLSDAFDRDDEGLLFRETFGPNALNRYAIVDEEPPGLTAATSLWAVADGHVVQTANYMGGGSTEAGIEKPGTMALLDAGPWTNARIVATLRSEDYDDLGVVFRFSDGDNYYRFSMSQFGIYRRLVKRVGGTWSVLWEDLQRGHIVGRTYSLTIETYGSRLVGYLDDTLLFSVVDSEFASGRAGFYCWRNTKAHFERLDVESLEAPPVLWQPAFATIAEVGVVDQGAKGGPSNWSVDAGALKQSSAIASGPVPRRSVLFPGTFAVGGDERWEDVLVSARLRSDASGSIGLMFRYQGPGDYYRFSMDHARKFRRLVRVVNGSAKTLWQDSVQYAIGTTYQLTIRAVGGELRAYLDDAMLFSVHDASLLGGQVACYCENNPAARFERVVVTDRSRRIGRWVVRDEGTTAAPSAWKVAGGALVQTSEIGGGAAIAAPGTMAVVGEAGWTDYRLRVRVRSDDGHAVGVVFRYIDANNYYRLSLDAVNKRRRLTRRVGGVTTSLWMANDGYAVGESLEVAVDAVGARLVGYLGATKLFDVLDSAHPAGRVGVYTWNNAGARFEHLAVDRAPLAAYALFRDRFLTGSRTGWTVVNDGPVGRPGKWSVVGGMLRQLRAVRGGPVDRDTLDKPGTYAVAGNKPWRDVIVSTRLHSPTGSSIGVMFGYEDNDNYYRFSMDSVRGYRRLVRKQAGAYHLLWEDPVSYDPSAVYDITLLADGLSLRAFVDGVPLFAVPIEPIAGRVALYSWNNTDARFGQVVVYPAALAVRDWLLDETFLRRTPPAWTVADEGTQDGPSNWVLTDHLRQLAGIYGGSTATASPEKPGTHILGGSGEWRDYRLAVRLLSTAPGGIGVLFRYRDADNYYRFSMDRTLGYRRLIKKAGGAVTVLWEDAVAYEVDREYIFTADCVGDVLRGYLDGVPLFEVADASHDRGRVGAYAWRNPGAVFREFRVGAPFWAGYYGFRGEARAPAGTRIRVHAGNVAAGVSEEWGVGTRFAASFEEPGTIALRPGAELRVRGSASAESHTRAFMPDGAYASVPVRILRKADERGRADGTAFALVPETVGGTFAEGEYRLRLQFMRNNQQSNPSSIILRQAGRDTPEVVELDIPSWR